jgi:hypothetical protein
MQKVGVMEVQSGETTGALDRRPVNYQVNLTPFSREELVRAS